MASLLLLLLLKSNVLLCASEAQQFGKYYYLNNGVKDYNDNKYYIYRPPHVAPGAKVPVVFQVFGSGWIINDNAEARPFHVATPAIHAYTWAGLAFVSTAYRVLNRAYFFGEGQPEELIHVDDAGQLTLDTTGKTIAGYKPQMCFLELITKSMYDTVESLEHLIAHADEFNVDIHRIVFLASSSGTAEVSYLSFVYHSWNVGRFTPTGMLLASPQFNLPVVCTLDLVWRDFLEHTVDGTKVEDLFVNAKDKGWNWCGQSLECPAFWSLPCNADWNKKTHDRYCASKLSFDTTTVAQLNQTQKWDPTVPEIGIGLQKLWLTGQNMLNHQPPAPFHIFAHGNVWMTNFMHHPMYIQQWAEFADRTNMNYTVLYLGYKGMRDDLPPLRNAKEHSVIKTGWGDMHYASSTGWRDKYPKMGAMDVTDVYGPHVPFICMMAGIPGCSPSTEPLPTATPARLLYP